MRPEKEQFLLFRIRSVRDQKAFGELFVEYKPSIYRFLCSRLPTREDADDALNTVFLRAWNYITATHDGSHHFSGLIFHIARNVIADYYRYRKEAVSLSQMEEEGTQVADTKRTGSAIEAGTELGIIKEVLNRLSPEHQEVIVLRMFEGLEFDEIAKRMEKNVNATRVTLHRALKELRKLL